MKWSKALAFILVFCGVLVAVGALTLNWTAQQAFHPYHTKWIVFLKGTQIDWGQMLFVGIVIACVGVGIFWRESV